MSLFLEPRVVEKPFLMRWLRATLQLFVRSPLRFGIVIALLGALDTAAARWLQGTVIPRLWIEQLGTLAVPVVWAFVSALARGADDSSQTWHAFGGFARTQLWKGILFAGAYVVALFMMLILLVSFLLDLEPVGRAYVSGPGQLLRTLAGQSMLIYVAFGPCFLPLLVLMSGLSVEEARRLSHRATQINDPDAIFFAFWIALLLVGFPLSFVRAYGLPQAAWLVFVGVANYVAYRDIFERRDANLPHPAHATTPVAATVQPAVHASPLACRQAMVQIRMAPLK